MANPFGPGKPIVAPTLSAEIGKADRPPVSPEPPPEEPEQSPEDEVDCGYWEQCLADAERAEKDWRSRGREIIRIYRNDGYYTARNVKRRDKDIVFNILFSNTEVMLPNIYSQRPAPVVRSRFVKKTMPMQPMPLPQPPPPPAPPAANPGEMVMGPEGPGLMAPPSVGAPPDGAPPPEGAPPPPQGPAPVPEGQPLPMTPPMPAPPPPGMPEQRDIDTAAAVIEKALEIVLDDDGSHEAVKAAVKDLLLPGRGTCRVRWNPKMAPAPAPPPPSASPLGAILGGAGLAPPPEPPPPPEMVKIWETVTDEYVYWEDILLDPTRTFSDTLWVAFRHLFDEKALLSEFEDSPQLQALKQNNKMHEVLKWTEESAAKDTVGGGGAMKTADKLGGVIKKAMVWEIWDKINRKVIWFIREVSGVALRVDPDSLGLENFFPIPRPLLAVTTTDSMLPRPYYDLYATLAADLDETSRRISKLTEKIKVRGGYNAANRDIANILLAEDGKMLPVDGVDLMTNGLEGHIWLVPILEWMNALKELYVAREQTKGAIYEVMGISDIMRGNTNPYETATAQRIKGTMGTNRLDGQKQTCAAFALELLRMKAEIIASNFDAETLTRMTGEEVTPAVEAILRDDFQRTCSIDIETDSTVAIDEQVEQESNAKIMMAVQGILQGSQGMLQTGVLPPPMVIQLTLELIKMMIHPIRNSRGVVDLIDSFQEQIEQMIMNPVQPQFAPPPAGPQPQGNGAGPPGAPPARPNGSGAPGGGIPLQ